MIETAHREDGLVRLTTKGGISMADRLLGGGGTPVNDVTEAAVRDLLDKLFK